MLGKSLYVTRQEWLLICCQKNSHFRKENKSLTDFQSCCITTFYFEDLDRDVVECTSVQYSRKCTPLLSASGYKIIITKDYIQNISISNKCCSFQLYLSKNPESCITVSTEILISTCIFNTDIKIFFWAPVSILKWYLNDHVTENLTAENSALNCNYFTISLFLL